MDFDIRHLAWLSRLELSEEEARELKRRLNAMRTLIDRLLNADTENVEPLYHPNEDEAGKLRDDVPGTGLERDYALLNAAKIEKGYVVAPRTVED